MRFEAKAVRSGLDVGKSIGRNTIYGVSAKGVRIGFRIMMVPVVIHYVGLDGFGIWAIISAVVSYMTLGVAGAGSAFQKYVAESTGTGDLTRTSRLLSTGGALVLLFSIFTLVPVAFFSGQLSELLNLPKEFGGMFSLCVSILAPTMVVANFGMVYGSIIMGAHRIDFVKKIELICTLAQYLLMLALLTMGLGLLGMVVALAVSEVARAGMHFVFSARIMPDVKIAPGLVSYSALKETVRFAGSLQLFNYLEIAYGSLLPFLVLKYFGPELTGIFAICLRLVRVAVIAPEEFLLPLLSSASWAYTKQESQEFSELLTKAMKFTVTALVPALVFLSFFGKTIFISLTGHDSLFVSSSLFLLCGAAISTAISRVYFIMYRAAGGAYRDIIWNIIRLIMLTFGFLLGTHFWKYNGGIFAYFIAELIGMVFMYFTMRSIIEDIQVLSTIIDFVKVTFASLCICALCSIIILVPLPALDNERVIALFHAGVVSVLFLLMGGYTLWKSKYLSSDERDYVRAAFASLNIKRFANAKQL